MRKALIKPFTLRMFRGTCNYYVHTRDIVDVGVLLYLKYFITIFCFNSVFMDSKWLVSHLIRIRKKLLYFFNSVPALLLPNSYMFPLTLLTWTKKKLGHHPRTLITFINIMAKVRAKNYHGTLFLSSTREKECRKIFWSHLIFLRNDS